MHRTIMAVAAVVGVTLLSAPTTSFAQPNGGASQRDIVPPGQRGGDNGRGTGTYGQGPSGQRPYGPGGPYAQGSSDQGSGNQGSHGQNGYAQGTGDPYGYPPNRPRRCAREDDRESLYCHHRTHSRGWYRQSERDAYLRGDHYRGYQDDGTGRRSYDGGGFGVGHGDYTRGYDPLRGY